MPHETVPISSVHKTSGYSHVTRTGNLCFISGQVSQDKDGQVIGKGDIEAQVRQALDNLKNIVEELGGTMQNIAKTTVLLTHAGYIPAFRGVRGDYFSEPFPASTLMIIESLASPDFLVEIEAIAVIG